MRLSLATVLGKLRGWNLTQWADVIGLIGLFLFSFGVFYRAAIVHRGLFLMVMAFAIKLKFLNKTVIRDHLLLLSFAFLLFLSLRTFFAVSEFKEHEPIILEGMRQSLQLGFFVIFFVAFWMNRYPHLWNWCVVLLFAGHIARMLRKIDWEIFQDGFHLIWIGNDRLRIGSTVNRFGIWNAVIFFGCFILRKHIWGSRESHHGVVCWSRILFWALMTLISGSGLVFSQSRSAWLAFLLVMPAACLYQWIQKRHVSLKSIGIGAGIFLIVLVTTNLPSVVEKRLFFSKNPIYNNSILTAIDARVQLYRLAGEKWTERPWIGFGPGTSEILIKQARDEYATVRIWDHFHNVVFDIMVQLGVVGLIFYGVVFYLIIRHLFAAKKSGLIEPQYYLFTLGSLAIIMIAGLAGQPFGDYKGIFLFGFLGGMCYQATFAGEKSRHGTESNRIQNLCT